MAAAKSTCKHCKEPIYVGTSGQSKTPAWRDEENGFQGCLRNFTINPIHEPEEK